MAMNLRLNEDDDSALNAIALEEHKSKQEIIVTALHDYLHRRRRDAELTRILREQRGVLDILATQ